MGSHLTAGAEGQRAGEERRKKQKDLVEQINSEWKGTYQTYSRIFPTTQILKNKDSLGNNFNK